MKNFFLSLKTSVWTLSVLISLFFIGSYMMPVHREVFASMNDDILFSWVGTAASDNLWYTWWFFGALAALDDQVHLRETRRTVDAGRDFLQDQFAKMQLPFIPSSGNFVMVNVGDGPAIFRKLLAEKVIVRPLQGYGLSEWLRITIGTNEQNDKCIAALKMCLDNNRDRLRHDRRHFHASG